MQRTLVLSFVVITALCAGCMKVSQKSAINADNTGTVSMRLTTKTEAIENLKQMAEQFGGEDAAEKTKELDDAFDVEKVKKKMTEAGIDVTSAKPIDKDGWKGIELEGTIKDVNVWVEKAGKQMDKAMEDSNGPEGFGAAFGGSGAGPSPHFYKTETEGIGQIVLIPPMGAKMGGGPMENLEDMDDEQLQMVEGAFDGMKSQFALDDMNMELIFKLPGAVQSVKGCKKLDDTTVSFAMKGSDITIDGMKSMFGMKDGVSATFTIPEGCKINFLDAPKKTEKDDKKADGEKKKKGGLKIGEGEGKGG